MALTGRVKYMPLHWTPWDWLGSPWSREPSAWKRRLSTVASAPFPVPELVSTSLAPWQPVKTHRISTMSTWFEHCRWTSCHQFCNTTSVSWLYGQAPSERGPVLRLELYETEGFHQLKCRKGLRKLSLRQQKGLSKYLDQTHQTADSSKYFKALHFVKAKRLRKWAEKVTEKKRTLVN